MVVFAHPDDETTIGPVMHKYAQNNDVYLVIATDGRYGVTEHSGIPAGDSLVEIRAREAACSCNALGIHPPLFLGLQDGMGMNGHGDYWVQIKQLKERLWEAIQKIKPTIIITFGPDADTGHQDHRMVGTITTELLLRENMIDEVDLYYFSFTKEQSVKYEGWNLNYLDEAVLDTRITYDDDDEKAYFESIRCHKSQYSEELMDNWIAVEEEDTSNVLYFRKFRRNTKIRDPL